MENEYMNYEETMETEVETEKSGMGKGKALLIGAGLAAAAVAAVTFGKSIAGKIKAKRASRECDENEVSDEDIEEITK